MSDGLHLARNCEEESVEAGQSSSSSVSDYSQDTFHSFPEENGCSWGYEDVPFESCSYDQDSELSSVLEVSNSKDNGMPSSAIQVHKDDQPQVPGPEFIKKKLFCKWIAILQDKEFGVRGQKTAQRPHAGSMETGEEAPDALQTFCSIKINQINRLLNFQHPKDSKRKKLQRGVHSEKSMTGDLTHAVPAQLMSRVRLKNLQETMKQLASIKIHQPSKCPDCCRKKGELAKTAFLRQRKSAMQAALLHEKIEETIFVKDALTLIGEIHQTLPKLSEDPKIIWQRLFECGVKA